MKISIAFGFISTLLLALSTIAEAQETFQTTYFKVAVNAQGFITGFSDRKTAADYLPKGESVPLLSLYKDSAYIKPVSAQYNAREMKVKLKYSNGSTATIKTESKGDYLRFELISLEPRNGVEAVVWGPYLTTINEKIGETICVVRDQKFAIGMQALNLNTIEGLPDGDDNAGELMVIDPLPGQQLPDSVKHKVGTKVKINVNKAGDLPEYVRLYRGSAARKRSFGSEIRLFSRDRRISRVIQDWEGANDFPQYVEPIDIDLTGSAIALFGCPEPLTLDLIGEIELGERLPHPMLNGEWIKKSKIPGEAYLLNPGDLAQSMKYAKECGFSLIHIGDIFKSWGHFELTTKRFPEGAKQIMATTDEAKKEGIVLGAHTLTMFTGKNDPYIIPVPSDSLCKTGSSVLTKPAGKEDNVIYIKNSDYFKNPGNTHTVKIGKELINYQKVSDDQPWRLIDCQRGQYGTTASAYAENTTIDKLANTLYKGFYPDIHLQDAYAKRLADVCNETGIGLMAFDGFNGSSPTGHGSYGSARFIDLWYKSLDKYQLTSGAGPFHYFWHIYSFMNWGEPWYSALRESQVNYRIENQRYFDRNLMPGMLGWFTLNPEFRPEEVEWIQARSAAFNAGFLLRVTDVIEKNGFRDQLFEAIREWQKARKAKAFSAEQIERMKNPKNEFHLEKKGENSWNLFPVNLCRGYEHKFKEMQTGEPVVTNLTFNNPYQKQPLQFYISVKAVDGDLSANVSNVQFKINNYQTIDLSADLKAGDNVYCDGQKVYLCDKTWKKLKVISTNQIPLCDTGKAEIEVTSGFSGSDAPKLAIEFKTVGQPEMVTGAMAKK